MRLFPSLADVRDKPVLLGQRFNVLAVFVLTFAGLAMFTPNPMKYVAWVVGFVLAIYAIALAYVTNRHQRTINAQLMAELDRLRDHDS